MPEVHLDLTFIYAHQDQADKKKGGGRGETSNDTVNSSWQATVL